MSATIVLATYRTKIAHNIKDVISEKIDNLDNTIPSLKEELNQKTQEMYR